MLHIPRKNQVQRGGATGITNIKDPCNTLTNWNKNPNNANNPQLTTQDEYPCIKAGANTYGINYWNKPLHLQDTWTISFKIKTTTNTGIFGLSRLQEYQSGKYNSFLLQYVPAWNNWGAGEPDHNTLIDGTSITRGQWHTIQIHCNNNNITVITDDAQQITNLQLPISEDEALNYLYLTIEGINSNDAVYIRDVELTKMEA